MSRDSKSDSTSDLGEMFSDREQLYRLLFQNAPNLIVSIDRNGILLDCNKRLEEMLGFSRDELLNQSLFRIIHPDYHKKAEESLKELISAGRSLDQEYQLLRKDGRSIHARINSSALKDESGEFKQAVCIINDLTEQQKIEKALAQSERRFRDLFRNAPLAYQSLDENGHVIEVNDTWCRVFGYDRNEVIGHSIAEFLTPTSQQLLQECFPKFINDGQIEGPEFTITRKNGTHVQVSVVGRISYHEDGSFKQTHCILTDITMRRKTENLLRQAVEATSSTTGQEFFVSLASSLAGALEMQYVLVAELLPGGRQVQTLAFRAGDKVAENIIYDLAGTPCAEVVKKSICFFPRNVQELFPDDVILAELKAESYFGVPLHSSDGSVLGILAVLDTKPFTPGLEDLAKDVFSILAARAAAELERLQADRLLRERDFLLRESQRVGAIGSYDYDIAWDRWTSSEVLDSILGIDEKYERNKAGWVKIIHPYQREIMREYLTNEVFGKRKPFDREYRIIRVNDGVERWVHGRGELIFNEAGIPIRMIGTVQDITQRRQSEDAVKKSEERLRAYIDHAPYGIFIIDSENRCIDVNQAACDLTGYSKDELLSKSIGDLVDPEDTEEIIRWFKAFKNTGRIKAEINLRRKDGVAITVSLDAVSLSDGSFMGFCSDITETKRLRELESRAQRLETAGQIAGQVAHDFNNLLAPLMAYPEFIREEIGNDHPAIRYLDDIEQATRQIADINQQLLTLSRRGHYNLEVMKINDVLAQAVRQMDAPASTLEIDLQLSDDLMNIKGGRSQIFRAVTNLLINAREAMHDNGRLTIKTENYYVDEMWVNYSKVPQGEYVKVTITDTGCGIPQKNRDRIFEPFFTTKTTDKKRGTGLGISVVNAVVKDHGGFIDMNTTLGEGTSFYLYFPVTREALDNVPKQEIKGGDETVLVIDDDMIQRDVCVKLLKSLGYRPSTAESGEVALRLLEKECFDLLILDMIMPAGIDGATTFQRALLINPDQKAIIVSGFAESERVAAAIKMGAGQFVKKPLTRRRLAEAVRTELDRVEQSA